MQNNSKHMKLRLLMILLSTSLLGTACKKEDKDKNEASTVYIYSAVASPTSSESVTIKNNSGATVNLAGWTIGDSNNPNAYSIPSGTIIGQGNTMTFNASTMGFQINDSGETLYLKNNSGSTVDTWNN